MDREQALNELKKHPGWYHTIDLMPGVTTDGHADIRHLIKPALPKSLKGKRCLDVGVFDGFWSFAMEDRGAAEIIGIDVDSTEQLEHPPLRRAKNIADAHASGVVPGQGFELAKRIRDSKAQRVSCNIYELTEDKIGGKVDFVMVGAILQHLRDPVKALERVKAVLKPGGSAVLVETVNLPLTIMHPREPIGEFRPAKPENTFTWWVPNLSLLKAWPTAAGLKPQTKFARLYKAGNTAKRDRIAIMPVKP